MFITVVCKQYRDVLSFVRTEFHGCLMTWVPLWHYWARFWRFVTREWTLQCTICGFVNSAEYHITWDVSLRSVTALSADCYLTSSKNTSLTVYFSAVALLHIAYKISQNDFNDDLMDYLYTIIIRPFIGPRRYTRSTGRPTMSSRSRSMGRKSENRFDTYFVRVQEMAHRHSAVSSWNRKSRISFRCFATQNQLLWHSVSYCYYLRQRRRYMFLPVLFVCLSVC